MMGHIVPGRTPFRLVWPYVQQFAWDYSKYPNRRPLRELVSLISSGVAAAIDEELKQLASSYGDKSAVLQDAKRKRVGESDAGRFERRFGRNVSGLEIHNTEYLNELYDDEDMDSPLMSMCSFQVWNTTNIS
jgi:hypothetical protein